MSSTAFTHADWGVIQRYIEKQVDSAILPYFTQGKVIKRDASKNLVWLQELGAQPIPIFGYEYEIKYYDTQNDGTVSVRKATIKPSCPKIGDTILVIRQYGSRRLPKCVGVLQSIDFEAIGGE